MQHTIRVTFCAVLFSVAASAQTPQKPAPSLPLGQGRPEVAGITRTTLKDDAKQAVTRVHFASGAAEEPHTHPYDVVIVPVLDGTIDFQIEGKKPVTAVKAGDVQFIPKNTTHHLKNTGTKPFEIIAIAVK